ncbi:MAG: hypothetical protein R3344_01570 [Acidobacteriota bacterium]|nr:hypothetical protein [Acidobacteriota bacterium]
MRFFAEADIEQVAELHRRVFPGASVPTPPTLHEYTAYFQDVFLSGPFPGDGVRSLVYEDDDHAIVGFLGVLSTRVIADGRVLRAGVCSQFCVDPNHRGLVGPALIQQHFEGDQDLSFTDESNTATRKLWSWAGGETALLYSLHWTRPLRPARFVAAILGESPPINRLGFAVAPFTRLVDLALTRSPDSPFGHREPSASGVELDLKTMVENLPDLTRARALTPAYGLDPLRWFVRRASARKTEGVLRKLQVRNRSGKILGWYVYYAKRGDIGQVLQVLARPVAVGEVLDHLFDDAFSQGVVALHGQVDPASVQELSDRYCVFSRRGPWTLVHSRDPALMQSFHRGEAFLTRLDGEWCVRFR